LQLEAIAFLMWGGSRNGHTLGSIARGPMNEVNDCRTWIAS